ncbi:molybdate ABC transporter substrate-binding protein [Octadecabacter sp. R77987]|uniref:molybdate ABC transporter substrate-binding protein n=1 Tax=Octadecabacter sp. R77987 TaxID=3093874 RepID=UPI00366EFB00
MKWMGVITAVLIVLAGSARAETITVFAASSMKDALEDAAQAWSDKSGHEVVFSFAASSALARQIMLGAPADIFVSANPDWMDQIEASNLIIEGTRADIAGNSLVLVMSGGSPVDLTAPADIVARLDDRPLAMALVDAVPAGIYGKAALQSLDLWDAVAPHVAQTANVRAALRLVQIGEARLGVVYASDVMAAPDLVIAATFPPDSHPAIRYPAAVLRTPMAAEATDFLHDLRGIAGQKVMLAHGFTSVAPDG